MSDTFREAETETWSWGPLLDQSSIAMALGEELVLRRVNQALCDLVGRPSAEVVGRDLRAFVRADDLRAIDDLEDTLRDGATSAGAQVSIIRPDGADCQAAVELVVLERAGEDRERSQVLVQAVDLTDLHRARTELDASGRRFRKLLTNARDIVSLLDADGIMRYSTATNVGALGFPAEHWIGWRPLDFIHPDDIDRGRATWEAVLDNPGQAIDVEVRMPQADGDWADLVLTGVNLIDDPDVEGVVLTARNVTQLRQAERIASLQASVLELVARSAPAAEIFDRCIDLLQIPGGGGSSAIWLLEEDRLELRTAEHSGPDITAAIEPPAALADAILRSGAPISAADVSNADLLPDLQLALLEQGVHAFWAQPILAHGTGRAIGACCTVFPQTRSVTPEGLQTAELASSLVAIALDRIDTEDRLAHQALHDGLTGLPNRTLLLDRLDHALARRERTGGRVAVLFCDLDRFKVVNDSLGHGVGDQLLVAAAERLEAALSHGDTVARFGGDEFVILLEDVAGEEQAIVVAKRIAEALGRPFELPGGQDVYLTTSIGIALATDHGSGDGWLRDADAAMYRAKEQGRDQLVVFDTQMRDAAIARLQVEHDLHRGLERGELVVHYLPTVDLFSGRIVGSEALVRWRHPTRGLLSPGEFVPVAEETGVIEEVGRYVLDVATRDMAALLADRPQVDFHLGVNISARQISRGELVAWVSEVCDRNRWPLEHLLLEITETALTHDLGDPFRELQEISELGVQFAIDDFGTGHSSLTRLGQLPIRQVKVDQSFVEAIDAIDELTGVTGPARIVDAVVALASALDLRTCAEGVETGNQLDYLRRLGCHSAQGYLFSAPLPIEQFTALVRADPRW